MRNFKNTMTDLIPELEKLTENRDRALFISEARSGEYHDYKNKKYACGKMALAQILHNWGEAYPQDKEIAQEIRKDVINGVYDEVADSEDIANMTAFIDNSKDMSNEQKEKLKNVVGLK